MSNTIDEIINDLLENAGFEENDSLVEAKRFVTAATKWLLLTPQQQSDQGTSLTMGLNQVEKLLTRARTYVASKNRASGGGTRFLNGRDNFRW